MGEHWWLKDFFQITDIRTEDQEGYIPWYEGDPSDSDPLSVSGHFDNLDEEDSKEEDPAEKEEAVVVLNDDVENNINDEDKEEENEDDGT